MTLQAMRAQARDIFMAGVAAADPFAAVTDALKITPMPRTTDGEAVIIAVGKAAMRMATAAMALVDHGRVLVVTNYENAADLNGATVFAAGHPVPDVGGAKAAQAVISLLQGLGPNDTVLALISGGGSALLPAPRTGISLADKATVSRLLLGCGAEIGEMNLIRQQLSRLKGGGMLRMAAPANLRALILSDVVGDDLRLIASGPTASPVGTVAQATELLTHYGIWNDLPQSVQTCLTQPSPDLGPLPQVQNQLIGSNPISVTAMLTAEPDAMVIDDPLVGDVCDAAQRIMRAGVGITLFGGETTVRLTGTGLGGRNQELALRVALLADASGWGENWVFLSGGTDGRDGPCDAAGGLVDGTTLKRMAAAGISPIGLLDNNDSYHALKPVGDLLMTGATGTNVADLQVLIRYG